MVRKWTLAHVLDIQRVLRSDGALGMSLKAHPLRRTFWTLSAWSDAMARLEEVDADRSGGSETVPHR